MISFREFFTKYVRFESKEGNVVGPKLNSLQMAFLDKIDNGYRPEIYHGRKGCQWRFVRY